MYNWNRCLILISLAIVTTACAPQGTMTAGKTIIGGTTHLSAWRSIEPHEIMVNIADLEGVEALRAEQRTRDNKFVHQRARFNYGNGWLIIHRNPDGLYNLLTSQWLNDRTTSEGMIRRFYEQRGQEFTIEEARRIDGYMPMENWAGGSIWPAAPTTGEFVSSRCSDSSAVPETREGETIFTIQLSDFASALRNARWSIPNLFSTA